MPVQAMMSDQNVTEIVESIFTNMMGLEVTRTNVAEYPEGKQVTAIVFLEGDWNGAISLECSREHACYIAGKFLAMEPPETMNDDVRDVLGEMANIIGGNFKTSMGLSARLSMPSVIDGKDYELRVCTSQLKNRLEFSFPDGYFWITVLMKQDLVS